MIRKDSTQADGFTIVEIIVVVIVIAILAAVAIVGYGAWRKNTDMSVLKSDLINAATAMEKDVNFQSSFPASVSTVFTPSDNNVVAGGAIGTSDYCVSVTRANMSMFMTRLRLQLPGTCPLLYIDPSQQKSYAGTGTDINDLSGNKRNAITREGTVDGAPGPAYVGSDAGGVFEFDGDNDSYHTVGTMTFSPNTTWSACVKTLSSKNSFNMFMGRNLPYFGTTTNGTGVIFSNRINNVQVTIRSQSPVIPLNTWNCYAFTTQFDGTNTVMSLYVNGALKTTGSFAGSQTNTNEKFTVGDGKLLSTGMWYPFNGRVGSVAIYDKTFSAQEVSELFEMLRPKYGI